MRILERGISTDKGDEFMAQKSLNAATKLLNDSILTCSHSFEIKAVRQSGHTEGLCLTQSVQHFGILTERLRRDAAFVQTCASDMS